MTSIQDKKPYSDLYYSELETISSKRLAKKLVSNTSFATEFFGAVLENIDWSVRHSDLLIGTLHILNKDDGLLAEIFHQTLLSIELFPTDSSLYYLESVYSSGIKSRIKSHLGSAIHEWKSLDKQRAAKTLPLLAAAAIQYGSLDQVKQLLDSGLQPNGGYQTFPFLVIAFDTKRFDVVNLLLEWGANPNTINPNGIPLFHDICLSGCFELAEKFVERKVDINIQDAEGNNALVKSIHQTFLHYHEDTTDHVNLRGYYEQCTLWLLKHGAKPEPIQIESNLTKIAFGKNSQIMSLAITKFEATSLSPRCLLNILDNMPQLAVELIRKGFDLTPAIDLQGDLLARLVKKENFYEQREHYFIIFEYFHKQGYAIQSIPSDSMHNPPFEALMVGGFHHFVLRLVQLGIDVNTLPGVMYLAIQSNNRPLVREFLNRGFNVNMKLAPDTSSEPYSVVSTLIINGYFDEVEVLIKNGRIVTNFESNYNTLAEAFVTTSVSNNQFHFFDNLLKLLPSIDTNKLCNLMLSQAVNLNIVDLVNELLQLNIVYSEKNLTKCFLNAVAKGHFEIAKVLMHLWVDPSNVLAFAFEQACKESHLEAIKWTIEQGLDPTKVYDHVTGWNAVHLICITPNEKSLEAIQYLYSIGVELDLKDKLGSYPPLHYIALKPPFYAIYYYLVSKGANENAKTDVPYTPKELKEANLKILQEKENKRIEAHQAATPLTSENDDKEIFLSYARNLERINEDGTASLINKIKSLSNAEEKQVYYEQVTQLLEQGLLDKNSSKWISFLNRMPRCPILLAFNLYSLAIHFNPINPESIMPEACYTLFNNSNLRNLSLQMPFRSLAKTLLEELLIDENNSSLKPVFKLLATAKNLDDFVKSCNLINVCLTTDNHLLIRTAKNSTELEHFVFDAFSELVISRHSKFEEKYKATFGQWNIPYGMMVWGLNLESLEFHLQNRAMLALDLLISTIFEGPQAFRDARYDIQHNLHLNVLDSLYPDILKKWRENSETDFVSLVADSTIYEDSCNSFDYLQNAFNHGRFGESLKVPILNAYFAGNKKEAIAELEAMFQNARVNKDGDALYLIDIQRQIIKLAETPNIYDSHLKTQIEKLLRHLTNWHSISTKENRQKAPEPLIHDDLRTLLKRKAIVISNLKEQYKDWKAIITDDPEHIFFMGSNRITDSCQRYNGDAAHNCTLAGYMLNGQDKLIEITDLKGVVSKAVIRLLFSPTLEPVLYLEMKYPISLPKIQSDAIEAKAIMEAKRLGIPLMRGPIFHEELKLSTNFNLLSFGGRVDLVYNDTIPTDGAIIAEYSQSAGIYLYKP